MLYVFLVLALLASCALTWAASGFATLHALWQVPVFFAGSFLALVLLFLLVVLISCLFVDPKKLLEKPSGYFRFLLNEFCRLALALGGVHVNVTGLEKVPRDSRFLLVSNHRFAFDPLVFYSSMPWADLAFLSKKENFSIFVVAQIMRKVLCLPVDRNNDRESLKSILKAIQFIKDDKASIAVFPEGRTNRTAASIRRCVSTCWTSSRQRSSRARRRSRSASVSTRSWRRALCAANRRRGCAEAGFSEKRTPDAFFCCIRRFFTCCFSDFML